MQEKKIQQRLIGKISKQPNEIFPIVSKLAIRARVVRIQGKRSNQSQETLYGESNFPLAGASALRGGAPLFLFEPFLVRCSEYTSQTNDTSLGMERSKTNKMLCASMGLIYFFQQKNQLKFLKINDLIPAATRGG
ncbi:MAG: hypothetical protein IIB46_00975 [Nitrospinae bacterium]|nr:hypothetical protein [Nitrospinota bacterium]